MAYFTVLAAFMISLIVVLSLSRKNLTLGVLSGACVLGLLTLSLEKFLCVCISGVININNLLLALAVGIIPIIGEMLNESGLLDSMIKNFKFSRKSLLAFSPAILGLLPMPGGALFSAPMVDKAGKELDEARKSSINVWFRHILHLVYPLAPALIIACEIAGYDTYDIIPFLAPLFFISLVLGILFLIGTIRDSASDANPKTNWAGFLTPLTIILLAPIVDFTLRSIYGLKALATFLGVTVSFLFGLILSRIDLSRFPRIIRKAKPWDFFLLILAIYIYQNVFISSGVSSIMSDISIPKWFFILILSFLLGFLTGRVSTPLIILLPIYLIKFGNITPLDLAVMYYSTILGYIISPIHPCLAFTAEYFNISTREVIIDLIKVDLLAFSFGVIILLIPMLA